ncbi:hypothetical protein AMTR_s00080p00155000 [Amborella trichopoda]|uniref:Uncharacterized protein n=1 Tax=Amborella trichopoda TaxID=13333 RepID=W1P4Z0_AMBTC|nr:hypothetical protein AMTR_s00080p00155000 [Amborella trichopoda]
MRVEPVGDEEGLLMHARTGRLGMAGMEALAKGVSVVAERLRLAVQELRSAAQELHLAAVCGNQMRTTVEGRSCSVVQASRCTWQQKAHSRLHGKTCSTACAQPLAHVSMW